MKADWDERDEVIPVELVVAEDVDADPSKIYVFSVADVDIFDLV